MADKREEKKKKKERTPGNFAQMKQVYQMTKKSDPNIGWILSLSALGTLLVFLLIGIALGNWVTFLILGLGVAAIVACFCWVAARRLRLLLRLRTSPVVVVRR